MTFRVGERVRLTGRGWRNHDLDGRVVEIERIAAGTNSMAGNLTRHYFHTEYMSSRSGLRTHEFWCADVADIPPNYEGYNAQWAAERVGSTETLTGGPREEEPGLVFNLGLACAQAGITEVSELRDALRMYAMRDRLSEAYSTLEAARIHLRGVLS